MIKKYFLLLGLLCLTVTGLTKSEPQKLATNVERVSLVDQTAAEADGSSSDVDISPDARYVVFTSKAENLVSGDTNRLQDVFLRDRQTGLTERISVDSAGNEANAESFAPVVSSDGRYVAFHSLSNTLVAGDLNNRADVFLRDRELETTIRISVDSTGTEADDESIYPSISDDGNLIVYGSFATNLVSGDTNAEADIFMYNRTTQATTRLSVDSLGGQSDGESLKAHISGDGQFVVFESLATNLVAADTNDCADIFLLNLSTSAVTLVSRHSNGSLGNRESNEPRLSTDARYVVFSSRAGNLVDNDSNGYRDVFLHDTQSSSTEMISLTDTGTQVNHISFAPDVSDDGRFVVFSSNASGFAVDDTNNATDVFIRDRVGNVTVLAARDDAGIAGNKESRGVKISSDALLLFFASAADNLIPSDANSSKDIYAVGNLLSKSIINVTTAVSLVDEETVSTIQYTFDRTDSLDSAVTVDITVSGSATSGADYVAIPLTVDFPIGVAQVVVDVNLINDTDVENTENIQVNIVESIAYVVGANASASVDITDTDQHFVTITSSDALAAEENTDAAEFTVSRSGGSVGNLDVNLTHAGTASGGVDYVSLPTLVTIPDGQVSVTIPVVPIDDFENEGNETIDLAIAAGAGYNIGSPSNVLLTIADNDKAKVSVTASDSTAIESDSSSTAAFTISRETAASGVLTVHFSLTGVAINGVDYTSVSSTAVIAAGQSSVDVIIDPIDDGILESSETVILKLIESELYEVLPEDEATVVISDVEERPTVSIISLDSTAAESGAEQGSFSLSRSGDTSASLTVIVSIAGSAVNGTDYASIGSNIVIPAGQSSVSVDVIPMDDLVLESTETVILALHSSEDYFVDPLLNLAKVFIADDEQPLVNVSVVEKVAVEGGEQKAILSIDRRGDLSLPLSVNFLISGSATEGVDFLPLGTSVSLEAGEENKNLVIDALSDGDFDAAETVELQLQSGAGYSLGGNIQAEVILHESLARLPASGATEANDSSGQASFSGDGAIVAFSSLASNWTGNDTNNLQDIYIADRQSSLITQVLGENAVQLNGKSQRPVVSSDASTMVFSSRASNAHPSDSDNEDDIFAYNISNQSIEVISVNSSQEASNGSSFNPSVSQDGRYVVFESTATNLVSGDNAGFSDIFLRDRQSQVTTKVSWAGVSDEIQAGSYNPSLSRDGRYVVFAAKADSDGAVSSYSQIFLRDLQNSSSVLITQTANGALGNGNSQNAKISADGRFVVFETRARNLGFNSGHRQIIYFDRVLNSLKTVSRSFSGGVVNGDSFSAGISSDGRFVSFVSRGSNLVQNLESCTALPFLFDIATGKNILLAKPSHARCSLGTTEMSMSSDGRWIAFTSFADDLVGGDGNSVEDIFLRSNPNFVSSFSFDSILQSFFQLFSKHQDRK